MDCIDTTLYETATEIVQEARLPSRGSIFGRPLPLFSHWQNGEFSGGDVYNPELQLELIKQGKHILPNFPSDHFDHVEYTFDILGTYSDLNMPVTFVSSQWEKIFSETEFMALPLDKNPNVVTKGFEILRQSSPFGPTDNWYEVGKRVIERDFFVEAQEVYPSPSRVILLSNNERPRFRWDRAHDSYRYRQLHGLNKYPEQKREIFGDAWISLYGAMIDGIKQNTKSPGWASQSTVTGYGDFRTPALGRWHGWHVYDLHIDGRKTPWPKVWDGSSVSYYTHDWNPSTDYKLWSPQIQAMNWIPALEEALEDDPEYWFEMSVWDGHQYKDGSGKREYYASQGQTYGPERYAGYAKYGMWLLRPRVVREYRNWNDPLSGFVDYTHALIDTVDEIHGNEALEKFWRYGELLVNPNGQHPYRTNITPEIDAENRWFLLDVDVNPVITGTLGQEIPVFALALKHDGKYLVYAYSPLRDYSDITITVPGLGDVTASSSVEGTYNFY